MVGDALIADRFQRHYTLSLADAIIAAFAARRNSILVHKDLDFESIASLVRQGALPYKTRKADRRHVRLAL